MSDDVFLKFEYDERDIVNAMRLRLEGRLGGGLMILFVTAVVVAIAFSIGSVKVSYIAGGVGLAVLGATIVAACRAAPPSIFEGTFEPPREHTSVPEPEGFRDASMSIDASEEGVAVTVGKRLANIAWADCIRLVSGPRCHILFHGANGFLVIPRRAFRNAKRDTAFCELTARCIAEARASTDDEEDEYEPGGDDGASEKTAGEA